MNKIAVAKNSDMALATNGSGLIVWPVDKETGTQILLKKIAGNDIVS